MTKPYVADEISADALARVYAAAYLRSPSFGVGAHSLARAAVEDFVDMVGQISADRQSDDAAG